MNNKSKSGYTAEDLTNGLMNLAKAVQVTSQSFKNLGNTLEIYQRPWSQRVKQRKAVKKRFHIAILFLISMFVQAQDAKYIKALDSLSNESAREFADQIISNSKTKFEFLRIDETTNQPENFYEVLYIPADAVNKERKAKSFFQCDECLKVKFYIDQAGENIELEKKGIRTLRFNEVTGKYLDLFPVWEKVFKPGLNVEKTIEDYKSRVLKIKEPRIEYRFDKNDYAENNWYIHNYS
ncbi:hypothetical protein GON26_01225 [Flavobacterium sp. GA093]|uniref:Uncharacterized protein n=1 Tax=Flavobacterium hydrocarbonoxydans TaxID=2683249 RepID=A0A6I4NFT1_9FLAO|nr:hypothetical protein [Flavobacterium hydrocarbonoxydans]MWB92971.1 hypothetical protein [Flavobacterium hydrocarbonoxydans]